MAIAIMASAMSQDRNSLVKRLDSVEQVRQNEQMVQPSALRFGCVTSFMNISKDSKNPLAIAKRPLYVSEVVHWPPFF
jgi:hypothetical protein